MSDFLSKILDRKRDEVRTAAKHTPERVIRREAEKPNGRRAFIERLARPGPLGMNVIAEIKRASPSKGKMSIRLNMPGSMNSEAPQLSLCSRTETFSAGVPTI